MRANQILHISEVLQVLQQRYAARVCGDSPNERQGERHIRERQTFFASPTPKLAAPLEKSHGGARQKVPYLLNSNCGLMKVIKQKDLFGEIEIHLLSPHLDKSVYGLGPDLESAKVVFEKRVVIAIRLEFKNFVSVFRNSKYNYNPIQHKTTLNLFNGALKRINKRTKLVNAQTRIRRVYDALELALSSRKARSFSSQMAKVNLLGEFIDFDFSSWIPAPENKLQTI